MCIAQLRRDGRGGGTASGDVGVGGHTVCRCFLRSSVSVPPGSSPVSLGPQLAPAAPESGAVLPREEVKLRGSSARRRGAEEMPLRTGRTRHAQGRAGLQGGAASQQQRVLQRAERVPSATGAGVSAAWLGAVLPSKGVRCVARAHAPPQRCAHGCGPVPIHLRADRCCRGRLSTYGLVSARPRVAPATALLTPPPQRRAAFWWFSAPGTLELPALYHRPMLPTGEARLSVGLCCQERLQL